MHQPYKEGYTDPELTPLEVHTDDAPWHLRVHKPDGNTR